MQEAMKQLSQFHQKFGFGMNPLAAIPVNDETKKTDDRLTQLSIQIKSIADELLQMGIEQQKVGDSRLYRVHLTLEEDAEYLAGLASRNDVAVADALVDKIYVDIGSAWTMDMPLPALFDEVHRSNMSKQRSVGNERMRNKGPNYVPPNIIGILRSHRMRRDAQNSYGKVGITTQSSPLTGPVTVGPSDAMA